MRWVQIQAVDLLAGVDAWRRPAGPAAGRRGCRRSGGPRPRTGCARRAPPTPGSRARRPAAAAPTAATSMPAARSGRDGRRRCRARRPRRSGGTAGRRHRQQGVAALHRRAQHLAQVALDDDAVDRRQQPGARQLLAHQVELGARFVGLAAGDDELRPVGSRQRRGIGVLVLRAACSPSGAVPAPGPGRPSRPAPDPGARCRRGAPGCAEGSRRTVRPRRAAPCLRCAPARRRGSPPASASSPPAPPARPPPRPWAAGCRGESAGATARRPTAPAARRQGCSAAWRSASSGPTAPATPSHSASCAAPGKVPARNSASSAPTARPPCTSGTVNSAWPVRALSSAWARMMRAGSVASAGWLTRAPWSAASCMASATARSRACSALKSALWDTATTAIFGFISPRLTRSLPTTAASSVASAVAPSARLGCDSSTDCRASTRASADAPAGAVADSATWGPATGFGVTGSSASKSRLAPMPSLARTSSWKSASAARLSSACTASAAAPSTRGPTRSGNAMTRLWRLAARRTVGASSTGRARCTAARAADASAGVSAPSAGHSATACGRPGPAGGGDHQPAEDDIRAGAVLLQPPLHARARQGHAWRAWRPVAGWMQARTWTRTGPQDRRWHKRATA